MKALKRILTANTLLIFLLSFSSCFEETPECYPYTVENPTDSLHVAAVSFKSSTNQALNLSKVDSFVNAIMLLNIETELICFPTIAAEWYYETIDYLDQIAESIPGPMSDSIALICKQHNIWVTYGMYERWEGSFFYSTVVIDNKGSIVDIHKNTDMDPFMTDYNFSYFWTETLFSIKSFTIRVLGYYDSYAEDNSLWVNYFSDENVDIIISENGTYKLSPETNTCLISPRLLNQKDELNDGSSAYIKAPGECFNSSTSGIETYITQTIMK